jgi:NAD(P)-dependent dehydrogenase (short-subunit alcohol dehydrogenase family)
MELQGRQVVITGGTGALGIAVVGALLAAGALCHVPYRDEEEAQRFPHRDHSQVSLVALGDLANEAAVTAFFAGLDGLWASIHLAGGFAFAPIAESGAKVLASQLDSNLIATYVCNRAAVAAIRRAGKGGRLVNTAARQALEPRLGAGLTAYTVAKAGVVALTIALAEEVAKDGILVNAIAPSIMDTPANRRSMPKADFSTWPSVAEVAATVLFLASPQNVVTRGAIVPVYGRV